MASDERYSCEHVVSIEEEPRHHLVLANDFVRAFAVEIAPRDRTLCHHHPHEYVLYVASDAEIVSAARDEAPKRLSYSDGECELSAAGLTHLVENLGERPFRNIVVELLPRVSELRRGASPGDADTEIAGFEARVTELLNEEKAAIFKLEIEPGANISVSGPAVIAAPYANNLNPAAVGQIEVIQNEICDLAWVPPGQRSLLRGRWDHTERAIVFQLGRTEQQGQPVAVERKPVRSLRAHADEPE